MEMGIKGLERRELGGKVGHHNLEDVVWVEQILEAMEPKVAQVDAGGQVIGDDAACCFRDEHLTTTACRSNSRRAMHVQADVALAAALWLTGVQPHTRRNGHTVRPG